MEDKKYWGYHLRLDCRAGKIEAVTSAKTIRAFTRKLVKAIDMVAFGKPKVVHFGSEDKTGYTLIQLIETSNIAAHFIDQSGDFYLDVFSCKVYDPQIVIDVVKEFFDPENIKTDYSERQA